MDDTEAFKKRLANIGLSEKEIADTLQKKKFVDRLKYVLNEGKITGLKKEIGHVIMFIAEKLPVSLNSRLGILLKYALSEKMHDPHQIEYAMKYLKDVGDKPITDKDFEENVGIGKVYTDEDIRREVLKHLKLHENQIQLERFRYNLTNLLYDVKKAFIFIDHKKVKETLESEFTKILGGKTEEDKKYDQELQALDDHKKAIGQLNKEMDETKKKITENRAKNNEAEVKNLEEKLKTIKSSISSKEAEVEVIKKKHREIEESIKKQLGKGSIDEPEDEKEKLNKLVGRDLKSSLNTKELIEKHNDFLQKIAGGAKILTRFPPEPNGYLHVGHAKAMRFSFSVAKNNGGKCYLRYDDTNPDKETKEYITNIEENVKWLGYEPWKITFASDLFDTLYEFAILLIKKGKAYVCHQSKAEVKEYRKNMMDSPYRNRSVEENLYLFEKMRQGRFAEKECCLRMKIDMKHPNPCMRDPTAYRIKYSPHPHVGDKWCIYPTYDYTHCVHDSLEHITHSLCTLEFEIRRDSYYWLLEALEIYRPYVWEYSRLNLSRNVLSKRRLQTLVEKKFVNGWDDPRLLTINGLRRRGYTRDAINSFIDSIGVTRRGNENILSIHNLEISVRRDLDKHAPRTMSIINPIKVIFENLTKEKEIETLLFPKFPEKGKRIITLTPVIYIENTDFREVDDEDFFGLSINKETGLKYAGTIFCKEMVKDDNGNITLKCIYTDEVKKTKGRIHWISDKDAVKCEARIYDHLFKSENPAALENYLDDINPNSLIIRRNSLVHKSVLKDIKPFDHFQFERSGYYVVDPDTDVKLNRYVFNLTVGLEDKREDDSKSVRSDKPAGKNNKK